MIIHMEIGANEEAVQAVEDFIRKRGLGVEKIIGKERTVIGLIGDPQGIDENIVLGLDAVEKVTRITEPYRLVSLSRKRAMNGGKPLYTAVDVAGVKVGAGEPVFIAGPCAVESLEQMMIIARYVKEAGAHLLRGGAYKPRTSVYTFQGLGEEGLKYLQEAKNATGLPIVTELMSERYLDLFIKYGIDCIQIGARNDLNYDLLKEVAKTRLPVLLKRGMSTDITTYLQAAEYLLVGGNPNVILCERGIKTFETYTRNTIDLGAVAALKYLETHLQVIVDPTHGTGKRELVVPIGLAAMALVADGIIVETHHDPKKALCDGSQAISQQQLETLIQTGREVYHTARQALMKQ